MQWMLDLSLLGLAVECEKISLIYPPTLQKYTLPFLPLVFSPSPPLVSKSPPFSPLSLHPNPQICPNPTQPTPQIPHPSIHPSNNTKSPTRPAATHPHSLTRSCASVRTPNNYYTSQRFTITPTPNFPLAPNGFLCRLHHCDIIITHHI